MTHHGTPGTLTYGDYMKPSPITTSDGSKWEVMADALDMEVGELRRENERLRAQVAELTTQRDNALQVLTCLAQTRDLFDVSIRTSV